MDSGRKLLHAFGSLWFAALLLVLLLVGMACATVFEATHGTEQALRTYYFAPWFHGLLALVAINVAAAVVVRIPFSRKLIGFVITHLSILVVLLGALVSNSFGVDGVVSLAEGETVQKMTSRQDSALTLVHAATQQEASIRLGGARFGGLAALRDPRAPTLSLGDVRVEVAEYYPDSTWTQGLAASTDPRQPPAASVTLTASGAGEAVWVTPEQSGVVGGLQVALRPIADGAQLKRMLESSAVAPTSSAGAVVVRSGGAQREFVLETAQAEPVAVEGTPYRVQVLRYLPHAQVGADKQMVNVSEQPLNPAIEVEITGPDGVERRVCFARFPGFRHGDSQYADLEVDFQATAQGDASPTAPIEVLVGPQGELFARFHRTGAAMQTASLTVGAAVATPWGAQRFVVEAFYPHAEPTWQLEPVRPARAERSPALRLSISAGEQQSEVWLQKYRARQVSIGGGLYQLMYTDYQRPLDFAIRLNRFRVGTYPGGERPRSFESHVTLIDPATGREQDQVISMNHPTKFGGYTFYQSSYSGQGGRMTSILSMSRDPGRPIVFVGYIAMMLGMLLVIVTRLQTQHAQRRAAAGAAPGPSSRTNDQVRDS